MFTTQPRHEETQWIAVGGRIRGRVMGVAVQVIDDSLANFVEGIVGATKDIVRGLEGFASFD